MADERNYEQELANIHNAIAESVLKMTDEQIDEELREEGLDPQEEAEKVRSILRDSIAQHQAKCWRCGREVIMSRAEAGFWRVPYHKARNGRRCPQSSQLAEAV